MRGEERWEEREQGEMTANSHLRVHSGPERVLPGDREGDRGGEGPGDIASSTVICSHSLTLHGVSVWV